MLAPMPFLFRSFRILLPSLTGCFSILLLALRVLGIDRHASTADGGWLGQQDFLVPVGALRLSMAAG